MLTAGQNVRKITANIVKPDGKTVWYPIQLDHFIRGNFWFIEHFWEWIKLLPFQASELVPFKSLLEQQIRWLGPWNHESSQRIRTAVFHPKKVRCVDMLKPARIARSWQKCKHKPELFAQFWRIYIGLRSILVIDSHRFCLCCSQSSPTPEQRRIDLCLH